MSGKIFEAFDAAVAKDKIYEAERLLGEMEKLKDASAKKEMAARQAKIDRVKQDSKELKDLLDELKGNDGWTKCMEKKKKHLTVWFKQVDGSPMIMTKARKIMRPEPGQTVTDLFIAFIALLAEVDLHPKWFPRNVMKSHTTLLMETPFSRFTQIRIQMPIFIPIGDREAVIHAKGFDLTDQSALAISFRSLNAGEQDGEFVCPEPEKKYTRMDIQGAYYLEMQDDGSIVFDQLMMMDLKISVLPPFIMNALSKGMLPSEFVDNVMKNIKKYNGSVWETRVKNDPELYEDIRQRLLDYLASRGNYHPEIEDAPAATAETSIPGAHGGIHDMMIKFFGLMFDEEKAEELASKMSTMFQGTQQPAEADQQPKERLSKRISKRLSMTRLSLGKSHQQANPATSEKSPELTKKKSIIKRAFSLRKTSSKRRSQKAAQLAI